jgi:hypothetical protein
MTENGLIVATQYTAGPKVHLIGSSQLTVKKDNGPDTGVSRSIDSCESMHEHAMAAASTNYTEIVLLSPLLKRGVGNTALNAEMNEESE